jgi:hypothetical protein
MNRSLYRTIGRLMGVDRDCYTTRLNQGDAYMKKIFFSLITVALLCAASVASVAQAQVRCTPDGFGGQRCTDGRGTTRITPDGFGGFRHSTPNGTMRQSPDGFGGSRISLPDGGAARVTPDGFGGNRITMPDGSVTRCTPDGFGGIRCR